MGTHVDKSAKARMLYAATPQRTWCQRCTTQAHIPPPFFLSHRAQRERVPAKRKTETHTRAQAGKKCMPGRRASRGREKSDEATNKTRGSQQPSKGRAQGRGHNRHTARGGHHTAPKHQRGEHQRDKRKVAPRTTTRTAQTPHTRHTPTPAPTARGQRAPAARPEGGQPGEGERLTPDAPHNGGRHPPPGDALPRPPRRATPARKGARRGASAGSPRPHRPHPGHTGRRTAAARPRGRAAGGGTAPDTRRPSQRWKATPPGDRPRPPPRHAARTGHAGQGDSVGPPHPHARAQGMWVADPNSPPSGRAVRGGGAPDHRRPSQRWKAPPREHPSATPTASSAGPQGRTLWGWCWLPRPHRPHPGHTGRRTPAARPRGRAAGGGTAPDTRRPSQPWQATPPGDGPPPPPRHAAPTGHAGQGYSVGPPHPHTCAQSTWVADPDSPPSGRAVGGGGAPDQRRPSQRWKAPPPGTPLRHPHSEQRRPARAHAVGPVLGPTPAPTAPGTRRSRNSRLPAPEDGQPGEGPRLTPDAPHNGDGPPPRGRPPTTPAARSPHRACRPRGQ